MGQTIKSSKKLAIMLAGKAKLLAKIIEHALLSDEKTEENSTLKDQMEGFKQILIHDLTPKGFADVYAQTIAYGMFAARYHDPSLPSFSREEAYNLIPKSNPFLKKLFGYIAGLELDDRIKWVVDDLVNIFIACNIKDILKDYGKNKSSEDPIIHFYEDFLSEYDPALRKARGVWYTPSPVVKFIVRAVDDILKTEFDLPQGLADTSKTKIKVEQQGAKGKIEKEIHKVQILDPAAGTGTFLAEVIKLIHKKFVGQEGIWSNYVDTQLLPRLNGFEILMASYAMAHLKLDLLLNETGYKPTSNQRFKVYLTNSLEKSHPDTGTLFANWLSTEANEANYIKRDTPVMCVMGNPPYNGESVNKGEWIMSLMEDYKKEPGGQEKLKERNPKWINDDYVKFLRYSQYFIEKNGTGVVAFINPHGFLDNPTFRGMRWNLLKTYDKIYTLDLHGNAKKKEVCPDGSIDQNVFDIQQGVSINFFIKTGEKRANQLGKVYHSDLYGEREYKYDFLNNNSINSIPYNELPNVAPQYFFVQKDFESQKTYDKGFKITNLFIANNVGIVTSRDSFVIADTKEELTKRINDFFNLEKSCLLNKYKLKENKGWKIDVVKEQSKNFNSRFIKTIEYRPFDKKYLYYESHFIERSRTEIMQHFINRNNLGFITVNRQPFSNPTSYYFLSKNIFSAGYIRSDSVSIDNVFPLYLYPDNTDQQTTEPIEERTPNLNKEIVQEIVDKLGLTFTNEKETTENTFAPIDILDYIYAVLHSPLYREKYKEFLKTDFPRVPYPKNTTIFWQLVQLGGQIRQIHLLESPIVENYITQYPINGTNLVSRKMTSKNPGFVPTQNGLGKVYINDEQYFDNVPQVAWEFYIGGYQPAQKWLKDRTNRTLEFDDILHYQKIIVALFQTDKLMKEIDKIDFL